MTILEIVFATERLDARARMIYFNFMKKLMIVVSFFSFLASATEPFKITGWKETSGITEPQAADLARRALQQELGQDEDGQVCGIEDLWGWEREKDLVPDFPQERGEIFAIMGYVQGPHAKMGCSSSQTYDCRVVFNRPAKTSSWKVEYTECEPSSVEHGHE